MASSSKVNKNGFFAHFDNIEFIADYPETISDIRIPFGM